MVRSSGQHKCGLIFCGISMLILGAGITVTGFLNDYLDPYDEMSKPENLYFTHSQYWLGIPLFLLGFYVIATSCCKISCLMALGLILASLVLVLSMFAVILEGPVWRESLQNSISISNNDKCEDINGKCSCPTDVKVTGNFRDLSCVDIKYHTVIYSFMVAFSAFAILVCLFCAFVYFRILGWMLHVSYDDPIDDYYAKAVNSHFINGHHGRGVGRANDVALGTYPQQ